MSGLGSGDSARDTIDFINQSLEQQTKKKQASEQFHQDALLVRPDSGRLKQAELSGQNSGKQFLQNHGASVKKHWNTGTRDFAKMFHPDRASEVHAELEAKMEMEADDEAKPY